MFITFGFNFHINFFFLQSKVYIKAIEYTKSVCVFTAGAAKRFILLYSFKTFFRQYFRTLY